MFLTHQFLATCSVILVLGSTAAVSEARHHEDVTSVTVSAPARDGEIVQISDLHPFTHIAYIPVEADLSSIKIESIKAVKVATKQRAVNPGDCNELWAEPGGSRYCPLITEESPVPAFRVTYSYRGPSTASDESDVAPTSPSMFTSALMRSVREFSEHFPQAKSTRALLRSSFS